jgi:hypothetical protein
VFNQVSVIFRPIADMLGFAHLLLEPVYCAQDLITTGAESSPISATTHSGIPKGIPNKTLTKEKTIHNN